MKMFEVILVGNGLDEMLEEFVVFNLFVILVEIVLIKDVVIGIVDKLDFNYLLSILLFIWRLEIFVYFGL